MKREPFQVVAKRLGTVVRHHVASRAQAAREIRFLRRAPKRGQAKWSVRVIYA